MNTQNSKNILTQISYALTIACSVTGLVTYLSSSNSHLMQWTVLSHLILGVATTFILAAYFYQHLLKTIGFRRTTLILSGLLSFLFFLGFVVSGWHLLFYGQIKRFNWVLTLHIVSAFLFFVMIFFHVLFHVITLPVKRKLQHEKVVPSFQIGTIKTSSIVMIVTILLICISTFSYQLNRTSYTQEAKLSNYEYKYGPHPFRPSQAETQNNQFIDKRLIAKSHRCITCHKDIGEQWYASVHKQAASDPTYVSNIKMLVAKKGISSTRYCEGCHAPIALLSGDLTPGGQHGGIKGTLANIEGISCLSCHSVNKVVHLKGVAAYQYTVHKPYLFAESTHYFLQLLHDHLLRVRPFQHRIDMGNSLLKDPSFCSTCHTQFMDKDMNDWGWVKMQDEFSAWIQSPFSRHYDEAFSSKEVKTCQNCHMPLVASDDPSANEDGLIRAHHFPGANTFLPILANDQNQLQQVIEFMQGNKISVSISKPERSDVPQNFQAIDESIRGFKEAPHFYYLGEKAEVQVVVANQGVGHNFPGGSIDLGEAWMEFVVTDSENTEIYSEGNINENNSVDPKSYFYRSLPVDRHGNLVWKHDLFNMVGTTFKRTIRAGKSDIINLTFDIPTWVKGPITIRATLKYRKLNDRYARWALKEQYIPIPIIDIAWDSMQIDIKIRKHVNSN